MLKFIAVGSPSSAVKNASNTVKNASKAQEGNLSAADIVFTARPGGRTAEQKVPVATHWIPVAIEF